MAGRIEKVLAECERTAVAVSAGEVAGIIDDVQNPIEFETGFQRVRSQFLGNVINELPAALVRKSRTRKEAGCTEAEASDENLGAGRIRKLKFVVAAPLEAGFIDQCWLQDRGQAEVEAVNAGIIRPVAAHVAEYRGSLNGVDIRPAQIIIGGSKGVLVVDHPVNFFERRLLVKCTWQRAVWGSVGELRAQRGHAGIESRQ